MRFSFGSLLFVGLIAITGCGGDNPRSVSRSKDIIIDLPPLNRQADCNSFRNALPTDYQYGFVTASENWEAPGTGPEVEIFWYGKLETAKSKTPIVLLNGGPGSNSHVYFRGMESRLKKHDLPFIFFDQRGTGCSSDYPELDTDTNYERLRFYGSSGIVHDAEALRNRIFTGKKWKLFGHSYGGIIARRYLVKHPEALEAVYSHGWSAGSSDLIYWRLKAQKRLSDAYFKQYPSDGPEWVRIRNSVPAEHCYVLDFRQCGPDVLDLIATNIDSKNAWNVLHQMIQESRGLNSAQIATLWVPWFLSHWADREELKARHAGAAINQLEMVAPNFCEVAESKLESEGETPNAWPFNECRHRFSFAETGPIPFRKLNKPDPFLLTDLVRATARSRVPFFVYAGMLDTMSPPEIFDPEKRALGALATFQDFPNSGHGGFLEEDAFWDQLSR